MRSYCLLNMQFDVDDKGCRLSIPSDIAECRGPESSMKIKTPGQKILVEKALAQAGVPFGRGNNAFHGETGDWRFESAGEYKFGGM